MPTSVRAVALAVRLAAVRTSAEAQTPKRGGALTPLPLRGVIAEPVVKAAVTGRTQGTERDDGCGCAAR